MIVHEPPRCDDARLRVSLLSSPGGSEVAGLRTDWERLLERSHNPLALFQSPEWFEHVMATAPGAGHRLVCVLDRGGRLCGIVPLAATRLEMDYNIRRTRLWKGSLAGLEVLGGVPLLPEDAGVYEQVFGALRDVPGCHALRLRMVPTASFCWRQLSGSRAVRGAFLLHTADGRSATHSVDLPRSFEEYLAGFKSPTRYGFRKKVRLLREHGGGDLRLRRFEARDEVGPFLEAAAPLARRSWQAACTDDLLEDTPAWRGKLADLADRGLLRSYVLTAGGRDCAYLLAYQGRGTLHYIQPGFDPSFAGFSPGTVLLFLMIEDLTRHRPPGCLSFGFGESRYKREFGNARSDDVSFTLLNRTVRNYFLSTSHGLFRSAVRAARRLRRHETNGQGG
jgi:CelD/BcsL family acetyltransferase involved in cellulose biosynthesis